MGFSLLQGTSPFNGYTSWIQVSLKIDVLTPTGIFSLSLARKEPKNTVILRCGFNIVALPKIFGDESTQLQRDLSCSCYNNFNMPV